MSKNRPPRHLDGAKPLLMAVLKLSNRASFLSAAANSGQFFTCREPIQAKTCRYNADGVIRTPYKLPALDWIARKRPKKPVS